jgi:1-acyl-sn-glycerol-3-phosphate acyltransferase
MGNEKQTASARSKLPKPAVPAIKPSVSAKNRLQCLVTMCTWLGRLVLKLYVRQVIVIGKEHVQKGPALIVMNHSNALDPLLLAFHLNRPIHFMVTEPFMAERLVSRIFAWLGQIPKRKLDYDPQSIRIMKKWTSLGSLVAVFPEGHYPWDGHPLPLQPGISQLVSFLDVPIIVIRIINGDRFWPPWAKKSRKTTLRIEIDPPKSVRPDENIEEYIANHIAVDPDQCMRWPSFGKDLSAGLSQFLRFCPACGEDNVLTEHSNELHCAACNNVWRISSDNQLHDKQGSLTIAQVLTGVQNDMKQQWRGSEPYFYSIGEVEVLDCTQAQWSHLDTGFLQLMHGSLRVNSWCFFVQDVVAQTYDWGNLILLRTKRKRIAIRMPKDSRALWFFAIKEAVSFNNRVL